MGMCKGQEKIVHFTSLRATVALCGQRYCIDHITPVSRGALADRVEAAVYKEGIQVPMCCPFLTLQFFVVASK
jgi:hypothetical protein